jgi:hypothetical protein
VNLPFPSSSTSAASSAACYASENASPSRQDARDTGAAFADLLAGASHPAHVQQPAVATVPSNGGQSPAAKGQNGTATTPEKSSRRTRQKPDKADSTKTPAQSSPDAALVSLPMVGAPTPPDPDADSEADGASDETETSAEALESSRLLLPFPANARNLQISPAENPTDPAGADPTTGAPDTASPKTGSDSVTPAVDGKSAVAHDALPQASRSAAGPSSTGNPKAARLPGVAGGSRPPSAGTDDPAAVTPASSSASATGLSLGRAEKSAAQILPSTGNLATDSAIPLRDAASDVQLVTASQQVKQKPHSVGIASAEASADMRKPAANSPIVHLDHTSEVDVSAGSAISSALDNVSGSATATRVIAEPATATVSHATAAIEATLDAVERARDTTHSSVELKLSFGDDTRLAVRVELRDNAVQTTFRTDSTELRQALASEWRHQAPAIMATAADRSVRIADPVFAPGSGSPESAGTSADGHPNARQQPVFAPAPSSFGAPRPAQAQASSAAPLPASPLRLPTSLRLNVFA